MTDPVKTWVNRDSHIIKTLTENVQPRSFKAGHSDKPVSMVWRRTTKQMTTLEGQYFRFGNDRANQEFVIYVSLERSNDVLKVLRPYYNCGYKIKILVILQYDGAEFFKRLIPFESISSLDMKFGLKCNQRIFPLVLSNLSSKVQVFVDEEPDNSEVILESDGIFYGSLVHTMASLSLCKVFDVSKDPPSVHQVNCFVFLDRPPSMFALSKSSRDIFCTECSEGSKLMKVFNAVKHSSETIDLTRPQLPVRRMEVDPPDMNSFKADEDQCLEPTDLSIKKPTEVAAGIVETTPTIPPSVPKQVTKDIEIVLDKSSNDVGIQASEKSGKYTTSKGDKVLRKVMTTVKPIRPKHRGFPLEKFLMLKVKRMQQRLLDLQKELAVKERNDLNSQSDLLAEAEVPSSIDPQSGPVTVVYFGNDGSTAIVPSMSPNPVEMNLNETSIALVPPADTSEAEKPFKCPMAGCNERFNNKSSVSRHKKRVHFPHKLPKCHNCEHVFPRPYMLQRHLDHKVCLPK